MPHWPESVMMVLETADNNGQAVLMTHRHPHSCTDPHPQVDDADAFVREAERTCATRWLRLRPHRTDALRLCAAPPRPIKASHLHRTMKETHVSRVTPPGSTRFHIIP